MARQIEVIVDKWPIGPQTRMHVMGDKVFIDDKAAEILVGMGKCRYVDEDNAPRQTPKSGRHRRRDMRAED